ncbi:2-(1,2-epoxy-1,2-dihydrophenyl)acetyl-CoA isomerase [Neobacillus niacini]|uniref:enoyl-CoA hydratase/isomerase family protein n=1 Tax=Neobacillus niacini TaxID=86668 RepID=UPI0027888A1D|nr:enoyl-CoA hydratase [Neobacillus niacini]MDQ1005324.1 2-(1,2-epoxy-1,2-dihydrophenyl)acetyl-CoA isomerase [Neobacillus niacini]
MPNVKTAFDNGVLEIVLNRPERLNAINADLLSELTEAVNEAKRNPTVRAVLLYGEGKGFCAGGDLNDFGIDISNSIEVKEFVQRGQEAVLGLYNMEKPVIAAVHGPAVGAGCNLAFACDMIIAEEISSFSEAFAKVGALPDLGGLYFLSQKIGMHKAAELIFTGKTINANTALDYGLINEVVATGQSLKRGKELANLLASGPTKALGLAKRIMHQAPYTSLESILEMEALGQATIFQTEDFKEGKRAFIEKRKPAFHGY